MDIAEILQHVRRGGAAAARELVQSYHSEIYRLALSFLGEPAEGDYLFRS